MGIGEHLMMIQGVINRMAANSFLIKGWSVTLVAGLTAFAAKDSDSWFAVVAVGAALIFGWLDAYYLALERRYRDLYDREKTGTTPTWTMDAGKVTRQDVKVALKRPVVWLVHGALLIAALAIILLAGGVLD